MMNDQKITQSVDGYYGDTDLNLDDDLDLDFLDEKENESE